MEFRRVTFRSVKAYTQEQLDDKLSGYRIRYLVAEDLVSQFMQRGMFVLQPNVSDPIKGSDLAGTIARHPIYDHLRHSRESGNPEQASADPTLDSRSRGTDKA